MGFLKFWFNKVFVRDIELTKEGFGYFVVGFIHFLFNLETLLFYFINIPAQIDLFLLSSIALFSITLSFFLGGLIIDKIKKRMKGIMYFSAFIPTGYLLILIPTHISMFIGVALVIIFSALILIDLLTIFTHETTILNRGRLLSYSLTFSFIPASLLAFITSFYLFLAPVVNIVFFLGIYRIAGHYSYVETKERLQSTKKFKQILSGQSIIGYLTAFLTLGFVLGNAFPYGEEVFAEPISFLITLLFSIAISGILLDNQGRKWSFTASILTISIIIIFSGILRDLLTGIFVAVSMPFTFVLLFTLIGDFSTERNTLKYRGRITSSFIFSGIMGFFLGMFIHFFFIDLYIMNPTFWWIPELVDGINPLFLIIILVWIMPLPEILSSKEADWADSLVDLYVFNKNSVCLYSKRFSGQLQESRLSEDLVTGGLTGVLSLISEITNEKKHLRMIDKGELKIYFSYGTHIILALTAQKYLPVLFKKSEQFIKRFEKIYHQQLSQFFGETTQFSETETIINRYFS
ncbi:MAG: conserved membrane protein of unknown function [Promethearchaeota archaeon]|nr:MAG: conserved membrane protein of unknown function [Candidatus Lokiarchaeota archaeon]